MIEKKSADIQVILHDHPHPPRLLVISKSGLHRFLVALPLTILALLAAFVAYALWKPASVVTLPRLPQLPEQSAGRPQSDDEMAAEVAALKSAQVAMQAKLSQTTVNESEVWLGPVKKPYALQDLTGKNMLRLDNLALEDSASKRVLRFNLINNGKASERITGHVFVFQVDSRGLAPYPAMTQQEWLEGIRYNKGESFSVARLRPVEAPFPPADAEARFLVLVFNREGDLLLRQELTGPFKGAGL